MAAENPVPGTGGDVFVPMAERTGEPSIVYFTREISAKGMEAAYEKVNQKISGKVAVKLHTGEPHGPNFTPAAWIKEFVEDECPDATIIETNTYYYGDRYSTPDHRKTLEVNGWADWTTVDITDEDDHCALLPVKGGKWCDEISVGYNMLKYDSLVVLTHFKGHSSGGFGGSNKNIGIGCASGHVGKQWIHAGDLGAMWGYKEEALMERITESTKGTIDFFGDKVTYVNVMRNMSVDCDCLGVAAAPVVTPNVGVLSSTDICAIDTACVDIVWAMKPEDNHDLKERIQSRHGLRQLTYMQEMGMGTMKYTLLDLDNNCDEISAADAAKDLKPFEA